MFEQLLHRLPVIVRLILGDYRSVVGTSNAGWLELRRDRKDWEPADIILLREMLPASLLWLLRNDEPDYGSTRRTPMAHTLPAVLADLAGQLVALANANEAQTRAGYADSSRE